MTPHIDADGHFIHPCDQCGKPNAVFGSGVSLHEGKLGTWLCGACKHGDSIARGATTRTEADLRTALQATAPYGSNLCPECDMPGFFGYRNTAGLMVWFCSGHRPTTLWADAKRS